MKVCGIKKNSNITIKRIIIMLNPEILEEEKARAKITEHEKSFLMEFPEDKNHPSILHVQGSAYEMGHAHGYLLADRIKDLMSLYGTVVAAAVGGWNMESKRPFRMRHVEKGLSLMKQFWDQNQLPAIQKQAPEILEEINGMVDGLKAKNSPVTHNHICIIYGNPDPIQATQMGLHCSSCCAWGGATADGKVIHAGNLDELNFDYFHKAQIIMVCKPEKGNSFIGFTTTGSGNVVRWMNDKGLSYTEMTSLSKNMEWPQIPMGISRRMVAQHASSIKQAYELLKSFGGSTGSNHMICEGTGSNPHGVIIEQSGTEIAMREKLSEFPNLLFSTNYYNCYPGWQGYNGYNMVPGQIAAFQKLGGIPFGPNQGKKVEWKDVDTVEKWREMVKCPRYERYMAFFKRNKSNLDLNKIVEIQSAYEMTLGQLESLGLKEKVRMELCQSCAHLFGVNKAVVMEECPSTNSIIFKPSEGEIWVAAGGVPAQEGPFWNINFQDHLEMLEKYE